MGKMVNDLVLDAAFQYLEDNATQLSVCKDTPTTYSNATTEGNVMLAIHTVSAADFTIGNGATGRMTTIAAQAAIEVLATGSATHVALSSAVGASQLLYVTTCTSQVLTDGNTVTVPAWTITIADPTA
jgi:hypothetical protein